MASALRQVILIAVVIVLVSAATACRRVPHRDLGASKSKLPGDNGFRLVMAGDPTEYVAEKIYNCKMLALIHFNLVEYITYP